MAEKQPTEPMAQPGKKGSKEWRYLRDTYHVTQSLIIQKIFHIAPWKGPGLRFSWHEWSSKAWIFKLICHLALLVLVTTLITIINWQWAGYQRAAAAISCRYFLPNTNLCSFDDCIGHLSTVHPTINMYGCSIYQRHDLESAILTAVREYYHINTTSIAQLEHPFQNAAGNAFDNCQPNNDVPSATMVVTFNDDSEQSIDLFPKISYEEGISRIRYLLNEANVRLINSIQLNLPVLDSVYTDIYHAQYLWNFQINFDKDSAISSFEVSSAQAITHICGIETSPGMISQQGDGSGGHGYVYSYENGIQVTAVLTIVVSTLYLLSLLLDLMDNTRLTFYVMDALRVVVEGDALPTSSPAEAVATTSTTSTTEYLVERLVWWWRRLLTVSERWMRWLVQVPPISRKELERLTHVALLRQQLLQDPFDRLEEQKPVPRVIKTPEDAKPTPPLAPAALYNISHTFADTTNNGPSGHLKTTATTSSIPPSSVQSTPQGSLSASLSDPLPPPLTPEDKQRRSLKFWQQLSYRVKLRLLDGWRLLSIAGALLSLAAACIFVQVRLGYYAVYFPGGVLGGETPRLMLGLAAAIQYLALLSYLRYSNRFTASALVLWGAFFKVQRIFFAVLPLAIGLALLGILVFGNSAETFGDLEAMSITLFSLMNCDSIWQTFVDTTTFSRTNVSFVGTLYVSAVFIVFNYLLLRLVLAVVESLYYYLRLYTNACRKRGLFRAQILQSQQDDGQELRAYATAAGVRAHSSQEIQLSLFRIYAKQQLASTPSPSPSSATVAPSSGAAGRTGQNHSYHREQTLADALMAASIPTETKTSS